MRNAALDAFGAVAAIILVSGHPTNICAFLQKLCEFGGSVALVLIALYRLTRYFEFHRTRSRPVVQGNERRDVYSLDHGRLNMILPPPTMWMNMGYWRVRIVSDFRTVKLNVDSDQDASDFPTACRALLDEVVNYAGLLTPEPRLNSSKSDRKLKIIDLGFGCGDQTLALASRGDVVEYTGVTLSRVQFEFAKNRLEASGILRKQGGPAVELFCADAARPTSWNDTLIEALHPRKSTDPLLKEAADLDTWVLALDTLYHFSPSRRLVLDFAHERLRASLMAFDLILAENTSIINRVLLRLVCLITATPFGNFMTAEQYRKMLISAGYEARKIGIRDISRDVFLPLTDFLEKQQNDLASIGLSIGKFRGARLLFQWWGRSSVVRGVLVVARR